MPNVKAQMTTGGKQRRFYPALAEGKGDLSLLLTGSGIGDYRSAPIKTPIKIGDYILVA